jgi:hypothetical protein
MRVSGLCSGAIYMVTCHTLCDDDKILEQINQTASKSVKGFKRYGVKSLGVILPLYMALIKLVKPSVPVRVKTA